MNSSQSNLTAPLAAAPSPPVAPRAGIRLGRWGLWALVLVVAAFIVGQIPRWHARTALKEEVSALAVPYVVVTSPQPGKSNAGITLPAEVRPLIEAPIYARASGFLKRW